MDKISGRGNNKVKSIGVLYYNTGERYEGEWEDNKKNGHGILYYANGDVYEAIWKNGNVNGKGKLYRTERKKKQDEELKNGLNSDSAEDLKETYDGLLNN